MELSTQSSTPTTGSSSSSSSSSSSYNIFCPLSLLLERCLDHVVEMVLLRLDFPSLRRCLWTCSRWRALVLSCRSRLDFEAREERHNLLHGRPILASREFSFCTFCVVTTTATVEVVAAAMTTAMETETATSATEVAVAVAATAIVTATATATLTEAAA